MVSKFIVYAEDHQHWPAKNGKPAGESFNLLLLDQTIPRSNALKQMYKLRLEPDEKAKYWGKIETKVIEVGVTDINVIEGRAILRGNIISVVNEK